MEFFVRTANKRNTEKKCPRIKFFPEQKQFARGKLI